ncbi:MAG: branched-chain amino acid ABC transporter substrate-binding protein, partial [Candidatus Manganitrophaceae bacterium]
MVRTSFLLIALLASAVAGCQRGNQGPAEIVIGVAGPMTGDQSKLGGDVERGTRLAVEEWNA